MFSLFLLGIKADEESRLINMTLFFDGTWNATAGTLDANGDFVADNQTFLNITFNISEKDPNTLFGHLKGVNPEYDVKVVIDKNNDQKFTIYRTGFPNTKLLAQSEMLYSPRKMPHAAGTWGSDTTHFKLVVLDAHIAELQIFREGLKFVRVYRFLKTPRPSIPSIWTALRAPLFVGFFFIAFRLMEAHEFIALEKKPKKVTVNGGNDDGKESPTSISEEKSKKQD